MNRVAVYAVPDEAKQRNGIVTITAKWRLYPGDVLVLEDKGQSRIDLEGTRLIYDRCSGWAFQRVSP